MVSGLNKNNTTQDKEEAATAAALLMENGGASTTSSLFVARFLLRPPCASFKSGGGGSCVQRGTSTALLHDSNVPWLCVTGGAFVLLKERCEMHLPYGRSCFDELVYLAAMFLPLFSALVLFNRMCPLDENTASSTACVERGSPATVIFAVCLQLGSLLFAHILRHRLEQRSTLRSVAVHAFHSDMQIRVTQLAKRWHPVGFLISTKERDGGVLDVVIEKSCDYDGALLLPSTNASRAKNMLSELDIKSIRFDQHYLAANTPLDIWLLSGLMLYRARTTNKNRDWKDIIDRMSPLLEERLGYTMRYELRPGWLPNTTKGTIQFQDSRSDDFLCPKKDSVGLQVTRRANAQVQTV